MKASGAAAALGYSAVSIAITLFNKAVLSTYGFPYPKILTLCQSAATIILLWALSRVGTIKLAPLNMAMARRVFPLSIVFISYVVVSLAALGAVNIPMFTALRRTTILFVMAGEFYLLNKWPSSRVQVTTAIMVLGAIIAAMKDLTFDMTSYTLVFLTNVSTAGYMVLIKKVKDDTKLDVFSLLMYNNLNTFPFLFLVALVSGELGGVMEFEYLTDTGFIFMFTSSVLMAFFLNLLAYFSTTLNSPLTQTVVGQLKNFVAFLLGLVLFADYVYDPVNMFGLIVGFVGGVLYGVVSFQEKAAKSPVLPSGSRK
jgi:solute carrier family 35 protein